mmetsp:Transcript_27260/g.43809  ORF Transcript_27260/g.43809 Transcript_27260/m.43809 type:complete len:474 (+) Transcript_27260:94-1515(+)
MKKKDKRKGRRQRLDNEFELEQLVEQVSYAMNGVGSSNLNVQKEGLQDLIRQFDNQTLRGQIALVNTQLGNACAKSALHAVKTNPALAAIVLAKLYMEDDLSELQGGNKLLVSEDCLEQLLQAAFSNGKETIDATDMLGCLDLEAIGFDPCWLTRLSDSDACLLALQIVVKLDCLRLKLLFVDGENVHCAEEKTKVIKMLVRVLVEKLKTDDLPPPKSLEMWRLCQLAGIAEDYSSVIQLCKYFLPVEDGNDLLGYLLKVSRQAISQRKDDVVAQAFALSCMRVLANLTHENPVSWDTINVVSVYDFFKSVADSSAGVAFDVKVVLLVTLINSVEDHGANREHLVGEPCKHFVDFFVSTIPKETIDALIKNEKQIDFNWTAEQLVPCSYMCILFGCLMRDNAHNQAFFKSHIPGGSLAIIIQVLQAFLTFQENAGVLEENAMKKTIAIMEEIARLSGSPIKVHNKKTNQGNEF